MRAVWTWLSELPPGARWSLVGAGGLLAVLVAGTGVWTLLEQREVAARRAVVSASATYRQAMVSRQEPELKGVADALSQLVEAYPRSGVVAQAWYLLGNVEYQRRNPDAALAAYEQAARRGPGTVEGLSRLGMGYAWEAKGDAARALDAYTRALDGRGPTDFLYAELLLGKARAHQGLGQRPKAVETYRKLLSEVPNFPGAEEVRIRLAMLASSA